jgi:hypothetical protein
MSSSVLSADNEDPIEGPSDYWQRSASPPLSPVVPYMPQSVIPDFDADGDIAETPAIDCADETEYEKRLNQVLSRSSRSNPRKKNGHTRVVTAIHVGANMPAAVYGESDEEFVYQPPISPTENKRGIEETYRDVAGMDRGRQRHGSVWEEEFGATDFPLKVSIDVFIG